MHFFKSELNFFPSIILLAFLIFPSPVSSVSAGDFKQALPGRVFSFPQDHYSHPEFKTEWWYYSGHLQSLEQKKRLYGYQLTFFRTGLRRETQGPKSRWAAQDLYFAHFALMDESKREFEYREKASRGSLGEAGAQPHRGDGNPFRIWIDDWSVQGKGPFPQDHVLKGGSPSLGIELTLVPEKNPVIHGRNGVSQKAEGEGRASHYYSITRLKTSGRIFFKGREIPVQGTSWMDHEFGSNQLQEYQAGWDWFSIQLENGVDLMLYQLRHRDGKQDPCSSGTIVFSDGVFQHLPLDMFRIDVLKKWRSPRSGATYPSGWRIQVPDHKIDLTLVPAAGDQELITEASTRVTYWEGSVKVEGRYQDQPVKGMAYVELTGYAKPFSKGI